MVILEIPSNRYKIRVKTDNFATIFDLVPLSFFSVKGVVDKILEATAKFRGHF